MVNADLTPCEVQSRQRDAQLERRNMMPREDKTGPWGEGPRTGRGAGYCNGYDQPGYANSPYGQGMGMRRRNRRGGGFGPARGMGRGRFGRFQGSTQQFGDQEFPGQSFGPPNEILQAANQELQSRVRDLEHALTKIRNQLSRQSKVIVSDATLEE